MVQHILVCAQDSVLAKKVRFLLARDECEVEILAKPTQLERKLREEDIALLILSRTLDGEDAIDLLGRLDPALLIPPTIVLGGQARVTADFITVIPDPIDTQAIYRIASEALAYQVVSQEVAEISDEEATEMGIPGGDPTGETALGGPGTNPGLAPHSLRDLAESADDDLGFTDVTGLDEIADKLDLLENSDSRLKETFDVEEPSNPGKPTQPTQKGRIVTQPYSKQEPPVLGGLLEPARFAKVLYQCWSKSAAGALIVARDDETLTIYFEGGSPVHVESSIPGDQLGRSLVARGRITEAQYSDGAKRAIEHGIRLGPALVDLAFFTTQELGRELGTTAREQIVGCFAARQGAFEFDPKRKVPTDERPYTIPVGHVIAEGLRTYADEGVLHEVLGDIDARYFKLNRSIDELGRRFPLDEREIAFLEFSGRAYNVSDASDVSGLSIENAHKLLAILTTTEDLGDFTPGVREFEARIAEERQRAKELEVKARSSLVPEASPLSKVPSRSTDIPARSTEIPSRSIDIPSRSTEIPARSTEIPRPEPMRPSEPTRPSDMPRPADARLDGRTEPRTDGRPSELPRAELPSKSELDRRIDRIERPDRLDRIESPFDKRNETLERRFDRDVLPPRRSMDERPISGERRLGDRTPSEESFGAALRKSSFDASPPPMPATPPPMPPSMAVSPPPMPTAPQPAPGPATSYQGQAGTGDVQVPPMPVPAAGEVGMVPRPLVYAKPLPRAADGTPIETQERTLSREHFQRGVTLLGQGNFASAEEAFRDAVALCSEEHVYLIGLARAIYYNPGYRADGKLPVLKSIVSRAEQLAPDDNRVATLSSWITHAETQAR